jgi:hypothetical protein
MVSQPQLPGRHTTKHVIYHCTKNAITVGAHKGVAGAAQPLTLLVVANYSNYGIEPYFITVLDLILNAETV